MKKTIIILFLSISYLSCNGQQDNTFQNELSQFFNQNNLSGVVYVTRGSNQVINFNYGYANLSDSIPINANTKFNIGSINKVFTGVLIMKLIESGSLSLKSTVGELLPELYSNPQMNSITIQQLLTHSSGLGNFQFEPEYQNNFISYRLIKDYLPIIESFNTDFEPGTKMQYSNSGMLLLGYIIEHVTGNEYGWIANELIHKPLNMTNTGLYATDDIIENRALGYVEDSVRGLVSNFFMHSIKGISAGGGYSTAIDLEKFYRSFYTGKIISSELVTEMLEGHRKTTRSRNPNNYTGYAFNVDIQDKSLGHTGGGPGISNYTRYFPEEDVFVAILMNKGSSRAVRNKVLKSLRLRNTD